jgi:hypothetical protein
MVGRVNPCWTTWRRAGLALATALGLSACASFDGVPEPVLPVSTAVNLATTGEYGPQRAMWHATSDEDDDAKRLYRDAFIAIHLAAIDARYMQFRTDLSRQMKASNFGLDLGVLALTSAGSLAAERAANILSAGAASLTGARAALSKEVYFEKALPALIASMDARRLTEKARIIDKMRTKSVVDYTIPEALVDLAAYQQAASLDGAIEQVTTSAAAEKHEAERKYANLVETCNPEDGVGAVWGRIRTALNGLDATQDEAALDTVSDVVGSDKTPGYADQKRAVITEIGKTYCSKAAATGLIQRLNLESKVSVP